MADDVDPVVRDDHIESEAEHVFWLDDAERWRADHRRLLRVLMEVQSAVLEQDAALDAHVRDIHLHDTARLRHQYLDARGGTDLVSQTALDQMHRELEIKHARAREAHKRMSAHHDELSRLIESLMEDVREPM